MRATTKIRWFLLLSSLLLGTTGCLFNPFAVGSMRDGGNGGKNWGSNPASGLPPTANLTQPVPGSLNEQLAGMNQRLGASEDEKKVLAARLALLEDQVKEKDKALLQATFEVREATQQIVRTKEELQHWKEVMESSKEKLRNVEKDNKMTLEAILRTLEKFVDRDKENVKPGNFSP